MSESDAHPSPEQLALYAEGFNASQTLALFEVHIDFPTTELVRATIDPVKPGHRGGLGSDAVNGGVLAALFDLTIGVSAALVDPARRSATMQLSMQFERPVRGDKVIAEAWVNRAGRTNIFSGAHIKDENGQVCAHGQGVVRLSSQTWQQGGTPAVN